MSNAADKGWVPMIVTGVGWAAILKSLLLFTRKCLSRKEKVLHDGIGTPCPGTTAETAVPINRCSGWVGVAHASCGLFPSRVTVKTGLGSMRGATELMNGSHSGG